MIDQPYGPERAPGANSHHGGFTAGLGELEILDLILATALFGWANRLMHTLGEPVAEG